MALFDFLRRKKAESPSQSAATSLSSDALRDAIVDAHAREDEHAMQALFAAHGQQISQQCLDWTKVPDAYRSDRGAANQYVGALIWLAEALRSAGNARLFDALTGKPEDNPLSRWEKALRESNEAAEALEYDKAIRLLDDILIDTREVSGTGVDRYVPITHGTLGGHCFHCGRVELARGHFERALHLCSDYGDTEGVRAYCGSLYEVERYLGWFEMAAEYGERCANAMESAGQREEAAWMRHRVQLLRAPGAQPLLRVVVAIDGRRFEVGDAPAVQNSKVQFLFERNRPSLGLATGLTKRGEALGNAGKYLDALIEFQAAADADPYDPGSRYNHAFTLMCFERYSEAADLYASVESLAPGWYNCRADGWLASQMAAGRWPHVAFLALLFEDAGPSKLDLNQKLEIAGEALGAAADLARLHLLRGRTLEAIGRASQAADAYRAGLACAEEDDTRSRLLLHLAGGPDGEQHLRQAMQLAATGNLMAVAMASIALRSRS